MTFRFDLTQTIHKYLEVEAECKEDALEKADEMYVLSAKETDHRIYPLSMDFELFKNHALQAAEQWQKRRQWFDSKWIASDSV